MSRQTKRDSARTARLEAVRRQQRRSAHRRTALIVTASLAVVGLVGGTAWAIVGAGGSGSSTGGKVALTGLQIYSGLACDHVATPVAYPQKPPSGVPMRAPGRTAACTPRRSATKTRFTPLNMARCGSPTVRVCPPPRSPRSLTTSLDSPTRWSVPTLVCRPQLLPPFGGYR